MRFADKKLCEAMSFLQIICDAMLRSSTFISRRASNAFLRILCIKLIAMNALRKRRRLPPVPSQTIALEPELKVGSTVVTTG